MNRKIVLASHGQLAQGLLDTAGMIIGKLPCEVDVYSLQPGKLAEDYAKELKNEMECRSDTEYVILCDIYGASVFSAMYGNIELDNVHLFSGMNLNMLLSICLEQPAPLQEKDIEQIVNDARAGIQYAVKQEDQQEEF